MRICHGLLCNRTAAVWMRGKAWCIPCSIKRFGFTEVRASDTARPQGSGPSEAVPVPGRRASTSGSLGAAEPAAPLYDDRLVALLEDRGWDELDLELALITHLEGDQ